MKTAHKLYNYVVYMRVKKLIYTTCSSILSKYEIPILIIIIPKIRPFSSTRFHMAVFLGGHCISRRPNEQELSRNRVCRSSTGFIVCRKL